MELCPREVCSVAGSSDLSQKFRLSEVPTGVRTSGKPEKTCSGARGYPHVMSFDKGREFRLPEVSTEVRTSGRPN